MKKNLLALSVAAVACLCAPRAEAKVVALYAAGQGGVENTNGNWPGLGFELGARVLILDGYVDYTTFGQNASVTRGILGLRGGLGVGDLRLVLRAGVGGIREENSALMGGAMQAPARTGGVARAGAGIDARIDPVLYLGFMVDAETYAFPGAETVTVGGTNISSSYSRGADVFAALKLTFELGI